MPRRVCPVRADSAGFSGDALPHFMTNRASALQCLRHAYLLSTAIGRGQCLKRKCGRWRVVFAEKEASYTYDNCFEVVVDDRAKETEFHVSP